MDIRTKFCLLIFANYLLLVHASHPIVLLFNLVIISFMLLHHLYKTALRFLLVIVIIEVCQYFLVSGVTGWVSPILSMVAMGFGLLLPIVISGHFLVRTSTPKTVIHGLLKWHFPKSLILTIAVMLRFFPTIQTQYNTILNALKLRGLFVNRWAMLVHPLRFFELVTVPLFMSVTHEAQELAMASITKGVQTKGQWTLYRTERFKWCDWVCVVSMLVVVVWIESSR